MWVFLENRLSNTERATACTWTRLMLIVLHIATFHIKLDWITRMLVILLSGYCNSEIATVDKSNYLCFWVWKVYSLINVCAALEVGLATTGKTSSSKYYEVAASLLNWKSNLNDNFLDVDRKTSWTEIRTYWMYQCLLRR